MQITKQNSIVSRAFHFNDNCVQYNNGMYKIDLLVDHHKKCVKNKAKLSKNCKKDVNKPTGQWDTQANSLKIRDMVH